MSEHDPLFGLTVDLPGSLAGEGLDEIMSVIKEIRKHWDGWKVSVDLTAAEMYLNY